MGNEVITEQRGAVLVVTLNRPDARNAVDAALAAGLVAAIERLDGDPSLRAGVLTGAGRGFCSGMDLKAFASGAGAGRFDDFLRNGSRKPLIAAVEGFAVAGGLEIALTCDLLVAARGARLGIPEVQVGLFAGGGGLIRLPGRLPYSIAMELALTADPITAEVAHHHGLVNRLTEKGEAMAAALQLADRIVRNAPLAVEASKRLVRQAAGRTEAEFWDIQHPYIKSVFLSSDAKEGPRAFAEKRPPQWTGA